MQEKLRKVTNAFKYVQATGVKVDADTLQRYEQIRKKVAKQLSVCIKFLQAQKAGTPQRSSSASSQTEKKDQKVYPTISNTEGTCITYRWRYNSSQL